MSSNRKRCLRSITRSHEPDKGMSTKLQTSNGYKWFEKIWSSPNMIGKS